MSAQLTRYLLRQLAGPFGFFVLVFTGVIWLTQSLRVVETVVNNGQSALVFLEFSLLLLPLVMSVVLPVAAFGATLYAINRLFSESEIVAMLAGGVSGLALARPIALFGGAVMIVLAAVTLYLMPTAARELRDRVADLRADVANALIFEGRFLHPSRGLTIYVREHGAGGEMRGVFVMDGREPDEEVVYTAKRAVLARTSEGPRMVMYDGAAQREEPDGALSVLRYDQFVYDLSQFVSSGGDRRRKPSELYAPDLVAPDPETLGASPRGRYVAEGHEQLSAPLYALALPLTALAAIVGGGFTRRGYAVRLALAVGFGIGLRVLGLAAKALTTGAAAAWPLMYAPPLIGVAASLWFLSRSAPRRRRESPA